MSSDPRRVLELLYERNQREASKSLSLFLERCVVESVPKPLPYGQIREPWQLQRDNWLVPPLEFVAGISPEYTGPMNFWLGYAKGHDKSSGLGRYLNWLLSFAVRKNLRVFCGARDSEQAAVVLDCMFKEAELNPWFKDRLTFSKGKVSGRNGAVLRVLTSDAPGIHGINPDIVVCDELTHWTGNALFDALFSGSAKRAGRCCFVILTNAGFRDSWQYKLRELAQKEHNNSWYFYEQPEETVMASWLSKSVLEQTRKLLTPSESRRLLDNVWINLSEDRGFLNPDDVDSCIGNPSQPHPSAQVYLGIDYGGVHDATALAVVWYDGITLHVIELQCWQGNPTNEIQIEEIEGWIKRKLLQFPNAVCVFDKHQLLGVIQKLENKGVEVKRFDYKGGRNNYAMAENLRTLISNKKICFSRTAGIARDGSTLADELKKLIIKQVQTWYRFDHEYNEHDDRTVAVGMAAMEATLNSPLLPARQKPTPPNTSQTPFSPGGGFVNQHFARRGTFGIK